MSLWCGETRVRVQIWFFLTIGLFAYLDPSDSVGMLLLAVLIHELGHIAAMCICRVQISEIELGPMGARITTGGAMVQSYAREVFVYLAGPIAGFIAALLCMPFHGNYLSRFALASAVLSVFNLLPVSTLDGGCITYCLLSCFIGPVRAGRWLGVISAVVLLPLFCLSFYALHIGARNISLLITCTYLALMALLR